MIRVLLYVVGGFLALVVAGTSGLGAAATPAGGTPLKNPVVAGAVLTQGFGCTSLGLEPVDAGCPGGHFHGGFDLAAPLGTPVRAAAAGRAMALEDPGGFGTFVVIRQDAHLSTLYGHLLLTEVHDGEHVSAGQVVGEVGSTGNSTGPHLHFEVDRDGVPTDPSPYLTQGEEPWSTRS